ncbi:MAG: helix-turn-helix transcriptional regulator [Chloroflexi bacterium]|nr:MAG: helix-turn-helix transcriptional regulator [Chloroflexota bacterium]
MAVTVKRPGKKVTRRKTTGRIPDQMGARIRRVRLDLGLSLADVAGKDFSRAFLNQVELGRSRPSMKTLQVIAERLRRPIEYFLQDPTNSLTALELTLAEAGTRLRQGDAERARALASELISHTFVSPDIRARGGWAARYTFSAVLTTPVVRGIGLSQHTRMPSWRTPS